jgi:GNAT superfamily N-acetyltransferase
MSLARIEWRGETLRSVIREFRPEDASGVAALLRGVDETHVVTGEVVLHRHQSMPAQAQAKFWVAEAAEGIVGHARAERPWDTSDASVGEFQVGVAPAACSQGIGTDLYERAISHLRTVGARTAGSWAQAEGVDFLKRRGHEQRRSSRKSALTLRDADLSELDSLAEQKQCEGFGLVALRDVFDRPRELFELDVATSQDEPADFPIDAIGYDDWLRTTYEHPGPSHDGSRVVVAGDRLVAWSLIGVDGHGRAVNEFTGTRREFRGRGLARLAKLAVAAWARDNGVEVIYTGNDAANAPMLAINRRMGYTPASEFAYLVRTL